MLGYESDLDAAMPRQKRQACSGDVTRKGGCAGSNIEGITENIIRGVSLTASAPSMGRSLISQSIARSDRP